MGLYDADIFCLVFFICIDIGICANSRGTMGWSANPRERKTLQRTILVTRSRERDKRQACIVLEGHWVTGK